MLGAMVKEKMLGVLLSEVSELAEPEPCRSTRRKHWGLVVGDSSAVGSRHVCWC